MFISRKELEQIRETQKRQEKEIKSLKQVVEALKKTNKEQAERNKKYDASLGKKYIHETIGAKNEEEAASIMDEWLNGAKDGGK